MLGAYSWVLNYMNIKWCDDYVLWLLNDVISKKSDCWMTIMYVTVCYLFESIYDDYATILFWMYTYPLVAGWTYVPLCGIDTWDEELEELWVLVDGEELFSSTSITC